MSTTVAVRILIENLTTGINQLMGYIIILKEQNSDLPSNFSEACSVISNSTDRIYDIGNHIAQQYFGDLPSSKKHIEDAAHTVSQAQKQLNDALQNFKHTSNRAPSWSNLFDKLKAIPGKTIILLQTVYRAEVERLQHHTNEAERALNAINVGRSYDDPDSFSNEISKAASQLNQVSVYLEKFETSLPVNDELQQLYSKIQIQANQILESGNFRLENLEESGSDTKIKSELETGKEKIKRLKEILKDISVSLNDPFDMMSLQDTLPLEPVAPSSNQNFMSNQSLESEKPPATKSDQSFNKSNTSSNVPANLGGKPGKFKPNPIPMNKDAQSNMDAVASSVASSVSMSAFLLSPDEPVIKLTSNISELLANLAESSKNGNQDEIKNCGKNIDAEVRKLEKEISTLLSQTTDPRLKERLKRAMETLGNYSTQLKLISARKESTKDPLAVMTRNFGTAINELLQSFTESKLRERGRKQ